MGANEPGAAARALRRRMQQRQPKVRANKTGVPDHVAQWRLDGKLRKIHNADVCEAMFKSKADDLGEIFHHVAEAGIVTMLDLKNAKRSVLAEFLRPVQVQVLADYLEAQGVDLRWGV